jgi:hypothetical protein
MNTYQFQPQLAQGEAGERKLDEHFAQWFTIRLATMEEQRQGIDRIFTRAPVSFPVEYKTDSRAHQTGNAFIETMSVDTSNKAGWAYTSQAQWLCYYVPGPEVVYIVAFRRLRTALKRWTDHYPTRRIPNHGYHTHGLLVPLDELERIAQRVDSL